MALFNFFPKLKKNLLSRLDDGVVDAFVVAVVVVLMLSLFFVNMQILEKCSRLC
jgi:hypothetical protein